MIDWPPVGGLNLLVKGERGHVINNGNSGMSKDKVATYPICITPKRGELFSSWMAVTALEHGLTLNALIMDLMSNCYFNKRDIDKYANIGTVEKLAERTGVTLADAVSTSVYIRVLPISSIEQNIYKAEWVTHVNNIYSKNKNFGLTFCPKCFSEDEVPYFRLDWRLSFVTLCDKHGCLLIDRCPSCESEISLYRVPATADDLGSCWKCGYRFKEADPIESDCFSRYFDIQKHLTALLNSTNNSSSSELTHIREYFRALYNFSHFIMEMFCARNSSRMGAHGITERHTYLDSYSAINRLVILELAFDCFHGDFECNFKEHLKLEATGKIRNFHKRKLSPCGSWCREHDYLKINEKCKMLLERIMDTKISTPI